MSISCNELICSQVLYNYKVWLLFQNIFFPFQRATEVVPKRQDLVTLNQLTAEVTNTALEFILCVQKQCKAPGNSFEPQVQCCAQVT